MKRSALQRMQYALVAGAMIGAVAVPTLVLAEPFVLDDFESADFNYSENGFEWTSSSRTSIVRDDGYVVNNGSSVMIGPLLEREWENAPGSSGQHAMRFRYPAGTAMSEQRFSIGGAHEELWARWWLKVPINFLHPGGNNKLFMFWMDNYSNKGDGSTVGMEFREDGSGGARWYGKVSEGRNNNLGGDQGSTQFISYPSDQGRWMQIVVRMKAESFTDAGDGVMQVWRRWEEESEFTRTHNLQNQPIRIPASGPQGFSAGYLMGWANGAYSEDTEFLIDDFTLSTESLIDLGVPPSPPVDVRAE